MSYDLAVKRIDDLGRFDLIVVDEAHYLKNWSAKRTKVLLAGGKGPLITAAPRTVFLTGTPVPNTPAEFYTILRSAAPGVIDQMSYSRFIDYFLKQTIDKYGRITFTANKRPEEFSKRLRSGFMARRLKKDVLPQLPDKRYKLVVFEAVGKRIKEVLKREADFSVSELIAKGAPVGSALPEIRKEMGLAKLPLVIDYLKEMLDGGVDKVAVFGHHVDVVVGLHAGMAGYGSVIITGKTSAVQRQNAIDRFMNDSSVRVFAGNLIAGGVGITLTSACEVAIAEPSWVPGENEQAVDRLHRIGQERKVTVHTLVVEGSLDAKILGAAAGKRFNINEVIGG